MRDLVLRAPTFAALMLVATASTQLVDTPSVVAAVSSKAKAKPKPAAKVAAKAKPKAKVTAKPKATASKSKAKPKAKPTKAKAKPRVPAAPVFVAIGDAPAVGPHTLAATSTPAERAAAKIEALYQGPLAQGRTSIYVADAATGETLFAVEPDRPVNPASNVKLLSTAAALDLLGADYRYPTRVIGTPADSAGVVHGGVYLRGSYDPTLTGAGVRELGAQLAASGVRRVDGDVVIGDVGTRDGLYRAGVSVTITAGALGKPAVATLPAGYDLVEVDVRATKTRKKRGSLQFRQESFTDDDGHARVRLIVSGPIGRNRSAEHYISFDTLRAHHAAHLLRASLRQAGVEVTGDVRVGDFDAFVASRTSADALPEPLAEHLSEPLAAIVAQVNKRSINWLADRVIMTAAAARYDEAPSMSRAIEAMHGWLDEQAGVEPGAGPETDGIFVDTGSGLSHRTQFSARHIVNVLRRAGGYQDGDVPASAPAYLASLSIAGVDGTLRRRLQGATVRGRVRAKTGTLASVTTLAGFAGTDGGHLVAFAVLVNGVTGGARADARLLQDEIAATLVTWAAAP